MAPTSASKRSSRASSSSSKAATPQRAAAKPKGRVSTGKVSYAESDDDDDDAEPSSSDIDGSDFEESRQQEKRKAEQQQNGSSFKKARTANGSGSGTDPDEDDDDGSDGPTDDDEDAEDDDASEEDEEETKPKGKGKYKAGVTVVRKVVKAPTTGLGELNLPPRAHHLTSRAHPSSSVAMLTPMLDHSQSPLARSPRTRSTSSPISRCRSRTIENGACRPRRVLASLFLRSDHELISPLSFLASMRH